ncbi:acetylglutamate kinase [Compostibacter hankyongensis]|uniref:Acetylglutamate kinase n=1 Tax=Compostibacter hankyongensis TaxID=1007089 RepID=A0ABP8FJ63_9BACT
MEQLFVIKIGGNVVDDANFLSSFLQDFSMERAPRILVHGGGKIATRIGEKLGIESRYVNGRRITDAGALDLVTMVYGGLVNKQIVARLQASGCNALGVTGADAGLLPAVKRPVKEIDYGFVGDIESSRVNTAGVQLLLNHGIVPVFAPLTHDGKGQMLNTNADTIASCLAVALSEQYAVRLIFCFEKKGVLQDVANDQSVIPLIDTLRYQTLLQEKVLADGILPKLENAFSACRSGVKEVLIGDARDLKQNCSGQVSGTLIRL